MKDPVSLSENRLIPFKVAAQTLGISSRTLYRIVGEGILNIVHVRGRSCISNTQLEAYLKRLQGGISS